MFTSGKIFLSEEKFSHNFFDSFFLENSCLRGGIPYFPAARDYGLRTGKPRQGRNAATVPSFALP